jgi:molybdopterin-guanine dinucleotide biosynthesis protein A
MGQDKALLDFGGQPLIQHVIQRLAGLSAETLVTTNQPDGYRFLDVPLVTDLLPDRGALGGLYTALSAASQPLVAVVACDLPFASRELLAACRDQLLAEPGLDAVIPSTAQGLEPLHAVYRRATCLPAVQTAIAADRWKMIAWHRDANVRIMSPAESASYDPQGLAFLNVNTPEDFLRAGKYWLKMD